MTPEAPLDPTPPAGSIKSTLPGTRSAKNDKISFLDLLIILAEGKRAIFWFTACAAILSAVVSLLLPARYTAIVTLLPPEQNSSLSTQLAAQFGGLGGVAALAAGSGPSSLLKNPNDMHVALLKSQTVEDAMVLQFDLMKEYHQKYLSEARRSFEHHVIVDGSGKDGLIHISVIDTDPRRAAELANGYVDQFRNLTAHLAITDAARRRLFFEQQLQEANRKLADAEEALKETEQKTGIIDINSQARALIESAAALRAQIATKEVQIQAMQTFATGENAQLVVAQRELESLHSQLAKLGGISDDSFGLILPKGQITAAGLQYVRRLRDVKYCEAIFEILERQFELAKLDEAREGSIVQVVDPAIPPDRRSFPKRTLIVLGSTFAGFILGILYALGQNALQRMKADRHSAPSY